MTGYLVRIGFVRGKDDNGHIFGNFSFFDSRLPLQTGARQSGSYKAWKTFKRKDRPGQARTKATFLDDLYPVWFKKPF
jgi:hypothetical protein